MPRFRTTTPITTRDVRVRRAVCDGCDPARPCEEHTHEAHLWVLTAGAFELRNQRGRHAVDPTRAHVLAAGDPFTIRHPAGPDICLAINGPVVEQLAGDGSRSIAIDVPTQAAITAACRQGDSLALVDALASLAPGAVPHDLDLAEALAHELRLRFADDEPLAAFAARARVSLFHACRVFRRATGTTLHGYRRELRLRHALARLIDSDDPLATIATTAGFASQSHLTNLFRQRFGTTPGRVRAARALSAPAG